MGRPDSSKWGEAERKEVTVLKDMGVATGVDLPPGKAVIRGKMIYAYKYSETGEIERYKARYVAMGCMQEEGRDYHSDALFAGTVEEGHHQSSHTYRGLEGNEIRVHGCGWGIPSCRPRRRSVCNTTRGV